MSASDNSGRISLSMLRGRSANQSVPSISFRFNSGSEDLIKIYDKEDKEDLVSSSIPESSSPDGEKYVSSSRESSPSRRESRGLGHRSSSLDDGTSISQEASKSLPEGSGLISRLTKTFEHKINVIRSEKQKEKDLKAQSKDSDDFVFGDVNNIPSTDSGSSASKALESMKKFSLDNKESTDTSSSPSKVKTTLVQDFTEQTNRLKSDFNKNIRPKISELRNRKSLKNSTGSPKIKSSLLQFLGKEDSIVSEVSLNECHPVDSAVEAIEDGFDLLDNEKGGIEKSSTNENLDILARVDFSSEHCSNTQSDNTPVNIFEGELKNNSKFFYLYLLNELFSLAKSVNIKYVLALLFVCLFGPLPGFLSGFILGISFVSYLGYLILPLVLPEQNVEQEVKDSPLVSTFLKTEESLLHTGWMNELDGNYYPESYHVSQTHTIFLRLKGSLLQIDNSRKKISKHARPNEEPQYGAFVHHREYELSGCEILLLPKNLPRKWLWSRKYPIFIRFQRKVKTPFLSPQQSHESSPAKSSPKGSCSRSQTPDEHDVSSESYDGNPKWESTTLQYEEDIEEKAMSSSLDLDSYEEVTEDMCLEESLCLFARTDREKDDWYRRFVAASKLKPSEKKEANALSALFALTPEAEVSLPFETTPQENDQRNFDDDDKEAKSTSQPQQQSNSPLTYEQYMSRLMNKDSEIEENVSWLNSFVGRILFDFLHDKFWANKIQERVQRKLSKLHIPYFVDEILVSGVELGDSVPQLLSTGKPTLDHRGIWVDLNVSYIGSFRMTLETKLDLMKLKVNSPVSGASSYPPSPSESPSTAYVGGKTRSYARSPSSDCVLRNVQFDTDTDDSVESSSEEEPPDDEMGERTPGGSRKFLRIVDTVTTSRYFQHVSEWRLLQRAMKGVSNTRIELTVEVRKIKGTLALNIPHIPADRLWYGFRGSPEFVMVAKPCLGERQLDTLPFLSDFIQKQLRTVFEKVFVLPNMDDLVIPIMSPILPGQHVPPRPPWDYHLEPTGGENYSPSPKASLTKNNISLDLTQSFRKLSKTVEDDIIP